MVSDDVQTHQVLESTSIDELWRMSSPGQRSGSPGGGCMCSCRGEISHNTEEKLPESCSSEGETGESLELSGIGSQGRHVESYFLASGSIRIPEAANFTSIESVVNEERAADEFRPEGGEVLVSNVLPTSTVTLHANELFDQCHKPSAAASSSLSLTPIHLQFEDIRYKIVSRKGGSKGSLDLRTCLNRKQRQKQAAAAEKHVLNGVSGSVFPGEILAMMGPSGSGKTTMLNILGGRLLHEKFKGNVLYNGLPYSSALKRRIGYVSQDDVLFPILTVRETLLFAALLRLSRQMSHKDKVERAETVLRELGLERCQDTIVGGPFVRGVSGGERKRTSIGHEILVDPSLLLLDEPTSGLDSSTAFRILQILRSNAQVGRVIVATIHQPSSRMFPMFDKLLLLSEGHPMYFGAAKDAMDYFASLQFIPQLSMNLSDFLLDLASGITSDITVPNELSTDNAAIQREQNSKRDEDTDRAVPKIRSETQSESHNLTGEELAVPMEPNLDPTSEEYQHQLVVKYLRVKYRSELERRDKFKLHSPGDFGQDHKAAKEIKKHRSSSWCEQFVILCRRNCKERRKDYLNMLRFAQGIAVAILLGMLWWRLKLETEQEIRDQVGLLFYICIFWCTFSMWSTLMIFPFEQNYLAKERASDMYCLSAYYLSSTFCDLVAELIHPTLFIALVYFMTGLKSDLITFSLTLLSVYLIAITAQAFGEFFGAATLSMKRVGIVSSMIMLIFLLAGGYYVQKIPVFLRWIRHLSIVFYGFNLLQRVQYSPEQRYNCHEIVGCLRYDESPIFGDINLDGGMHDALALIAMTVIYKCLAYLCLRRV